MLTDFAVKKIVDAVDCSPWGSTAGRSALHSSGQALQKQRRAPLYTPDERKRRDESRWTYVQGVLAPLQFVAFLVSLGLVVNYLSTGNGLSAATTSIVVKTLILYTIMVTGSLWEHDVYGRYLFAKPFFWEDVFSMLVLALHTLYLIVASASIASPRTQMLIALAAYAAYVVNAAQFVLKLRAARQGDGQTIRSSADQRNGSPGFAQ